jgi:hypothetical protein
MCTAHCYKHNAVLHKNAASARVHLLMYNVTAQAQDRALKVAVVLRNTALQLAAQTAVVLWQWQARSC